MGGLIVRGLLTEPEQRWMYDTLYAMGESDSGEYAGLRSTSTVKAAAELNPDNRPQPCASACFCTRTHHNNALPLSRERAIGLIVRRARRNVALSHGFTRTRAPRMLGRGRRDCSSGRRS